MKRIAILIALAAPALAAEHGGEASSMTGWKWANFALLAGGLGYLIAKKAPAFFRGRTDEIRKGIAEAAQLKAGAEARAAEIEARLARLDAEIEELKSAARREMEADGERLRAETAAHLAKIRARAEQEIASAAKAATNELRSYSADLALTLAARQLRERMTGEVERGLVESFVADLARPGVN